MGPSVFDMFKIGVGPSSSHTMGPMSAAARFLDRLRAEPRAAGAARRLRCRLFGSLAFTGAGHGTARAVALGLLGRAPDTLDPDAAPALEAALAAERLLRPEGLAPLAFDPAADLVFDYETEPPGHPNALEFTALAADGAVLAAETYCSVGGGFVFTLAEWMAEGARGPGEAAGAGAPAPHPFRSAAEMLRMSAESGLSIAEMQRANEAARDPDGAAALDARLDAIWAAMAACMARGLREEGVLPGGLQVRRRARALHAQLLAEAGDNAPAPHAMTDWLCLYAMAVNEENAAGGRVVTAPTNGAAGVAPAVARYLRDHVPEAKRGPADEAIRVFLLTAAAIGGLIKSNASISGAEVGCQGEVGSAAAMAAAGLCAALGGGAAQVENAAEIALEHHLGMTCDPVGGLVQVPCIERNGLGAVKAVAAASLALRGDGVHFMPLDNCIEAMRQTGLDMDARYRETSRGGLAVNLPQC